MRPPYATRFKENTDLWQITAQRTSPSPPIDPPTKPGKGGNRLAILAPNAANDEISQTISANAIAKTASVFRMNKTVQSDANGRGKINSQRSGKSGSSQNEDKAPQAAKRIATEITLSPACSESSVISVPLSIGDAPQKLPRSLAPNRKLAYCGQVVAYSSLTTG